jgi:hypothetical protein
MIGLIFGNSKVIFQPARRREKLTHMSTTGREQVGVMSFDEIAAPVTALSGGRLSC